MMFIDDLARKIQERLRTYRDSLDTRSYREAADTPDWIAEVIRAELKESPYELLVRITAEEQGISQFQAAMKLTVIHVHLKAPEDADRFAAIGRARMLAGEK